MTPFLRSIEIVRRDGDDRYPFSVPVVRALDSMTFEAPITFFVGENGSGKSTLLEAIAAGARLATLGTAAIERDPTLAPARRLAQALRLSWRVRARKGFFLRAEDFFGFVRRLAEQREELARDTVEMEQRLEDRSAYARGLATGPLRASLGDMERRYGQDFDARSHGEQFLELARGRMVPGGLYLIDEPEAALSPRSQLAFMALLQQAVEEGSQCLVATHSPIILATPGAEIMSFDRAPPAKVPWAELEHVSLTKAFLDAPERFLKHLKR